jgi:LytS/YehU family sensor histidine kinase
LAVGVAMLAGTGIGAGLSAVATGMDPSVMDSPVGFLKLMLMGLVFGTIISYFFISRHTIASSQAAAREERIRRLTSENMATEARLRLLQAQIEPHFLFNVLSHVLSLLDTNPQAGKAMLGDLIAYLRRSFSQMRQQQSTLGQEMALIEAYLNLFKVRMGQRLDFKLEMDEKLGQVSFPPLLLQPLVENAVRHGLEPRIEGGRLMIRAENGPRGLRIEVADSGGGLSPASRPGGGLANVRERLESLYGENGRLILEENHPRGLKAIIEVPHGSA